MFPHWVLSCLLLPPVQPVEHQVQLVSSVCLVDFRHVVIHVCCVLCSLEWFLSLLPDLSWGHPRLWLIDSLVTLKSLFLPEREPSPNYLKQKGRVRGKKEKKRELHARADFRGKRTGTKGLFWVSLAPPLRQLLTPRRCLRIYCIPLSLEFLVFLFLWVVSYL